MEQEDINKFNLLADMLLFGSTINYPFSDESQCEETVQRLQYILDKMKKLIDK